MTKVLIVDDELLVRVGIKSSIDWGQHYFEVIGEASNGKEAMAILRQEEVHIVLLDIEMPVMNGIQVLEAIKDEAIDVKVIILSCHEDFIYAQQALRLGAVDYILKLSVNSQKLLELLLTVQQSIRSAIGDEKTMSLQEEWQRIASDECPLDLDLLQKKGSKLMSSEGCLMLFTVDTCTKRKPASSPSDRRLFAQSVMNLTSEIINDYGTGDVFRLDDLHYVGVMNAKVMLQNKLSNMLEDLQKALSRYMQITVSVALNARAIDLHDFKKALDALDKVNEKRFIHGPESILYEVSSKKDGLIEHDKLLFDTTMERNLERAIEYGDEQQAADVWKQYFHDVSEASMSFVRQTFNGDLDEMLHVYSKELKLYHQQFQDITGYDGIAERSELRHFEYMHQTMDWFERFNRLYFKHLKVMRDDTLDKDIKGCLDYIQNHYNHDITVSFLAERLNMSASYFGSLFKKKVGVNVTHYLTDYRMEMAKILLRTTDKSITEISDEIGYDNIYYFSNVFKKKFNMSPNIYRKQLKSS